MTWYFDPTEDTVDVYDDTGALVADSRPFSGAWSGVPDEVFTVMQEQAVQAFETGDIERTARIVTAAAFEDIEQGPP